MRNLRFAVLLALFAVFSIPSFAQKMRSGVADMLNLYHLMKAEGRDDCGYIAVALRELDNPYYRSPSPSDRTETIALAKRCGLRGIPQK
jgi:hypothetical protein